MPGYEVAGAVKGRADSFRTEDAALDYCGDGLEEIRVPELERSGTHKALS